MAQNGDSDVVSVYVGNLAWATTSAELESHFTNAGFAVASATVMGESSGRSKGFGVVELNNTDDATRAINELTGTDLGGREIRVEERKKKKANNGENNGGNRPKKVREPEYNASGDAACRVYVGNLAWAVTGAELEAHFTSTGFSIVEATVIGEARGRSKGYGIVELSSVEEAERAINELTDTDLGGRSIFVRTDRAEADRPQNKRNNN